MTRRLPIRIQPMLATLVAEPFDKPGWVYEEKYDGDRMLAYKEGGRVLLLSRNGKDNTDRFPKIAAAIEKLRPATLVLDGEVVVFDPKSVSRFQLLQQRKGEPVYAVFDCLFADGKDCGTSRYRHAARPLKKSFCRMASCCFRIVSAHMASKPTKSQSAAGTKAS